MLVSRSRNNSTRGAVVSSAETASKIAESGLGGGVDEACLEGSEAGEGARNLWTATRMRDDA